MISLQRLYEKDDLTGFIAQAERFIRYYNRVSEKHDLASAEHYWAMVAMVDNEKNNSLHLYDLVERIKQREHPKAIPTQNNMSD